MVKGSRSRPLEVSTLSSIKLQPKISFLYQLWTPFKNKNFLPALLDLGLLLLKLLSKRGVLSLQMFNLNVLLAYFFIVRNLEALLYTFNLYIMFCLICDLQFSFLSFEILFTLHLKLYFSLLQISIFLTLVGLLPLPDGLIVAYEAHYYLIFIF